jgi:putative DNA-binding protein
MEARLETLERWMQAVVMHPKGAEAGIRARAARSLVADAARDPEAVVLPSRQLTSIERLGIYAHMYFARLVEVMEGEYPTTRQLLGEQAFAAACRRYIAKHPSRTRTLNSLSAWFPDFLAKTLPRTARNGLAADVARIERAMEDVFDAPRAEPMTAAQFAAIGAGDRNRATLRVTPALVLLKLRYPANSFMTALRRGGKPRPPRPRATHVIVFRRGYQVFRRDQEPEQWKLLESLVAGKPLAAAVRASIGGRAASADRVAKRLGKWFEEWASAHLFVS